MPSQTNPLRGALLSLAGFSVYACADVSIKALGLSLDPVQIMFLAALCTLPWILLQILVMERRVSLWPVLPGWTVVRVVITVVNSWLVTYTFTHLPLAQSYAIFFTMPLLITLLAWPFLGEPVDALRGLVILGGFCGVLIALRPGEVALQPGHLTAICGAVLGAANSLILRRVGTRESTGVILIYPAVTQVLVTALVVHSVWHPMTGHLWQISLLQGFLSTLGGVLLIAAYRCATAIVVAPMQYSQVICAGILGAMFFDERITPMTLLGIMVIIGAGLALLAQANRGATGKSGLAGANDP